MINIEELKISNKSYINKDFQKLYPEILELARSLSAKWDPSTSNESDPGVVLLKTLGFMGDKLNYNIDKNILEAFMPSATQESSMRNLCEMNGYFPRYYQSAVVDVSFMYTGTKLTDDSFTLKAFETVITDVDSTLTYTLLTDCLISERYVTVVGQAIEGQLETLLINNNEEIHLANLDDNNRVYFPEKFIAENGIFIENISNIATYWTKVNNLNTVEPGQFVFKFGYDSARGLPYVEFPLDIASLIGEGLYIKYIRTAGKAGNIKAGFLNRLSSPAQIFTASTNTLIYPDTNNNENEQAVLIISNLSDTINGTDPETINEAYNSFKRVVGTFDTLVTCRDYANALYINGLVSNVQVTDRRTDINYANNILSFNQYGVVKLNDTDMDQITPFDLCVYPLNPIVTAYTPTTYKNSFLPLPTADTSVILAGLDTYKTISHNYKTLEPTDTFLYKNYYSLNAKITTNAKVNTFEQNSILGNINTALYKKFNARELEYGYEIPFDILLETIQTADARIKNVSLEEPRIDSVVLTKNGDETPLFDNDNKSQYLKLLSKNILAGRTSLFDYNTDFDFEFGQTAVSIPNDGESEATADFIHNNIKSITTEVTILDTDITSAGGYTLRENEYVQVIAPSLTTEIIYPAYVNYRWSGADILADTEHKITGDDYLIVNYTDSNDTSIAIKYTSDKIIRYRLERNPIEVDNKTVYIATPIGPEITLAAGDYNIFKPINVDLSTPPEESTTRITKQIRFGGVDILAFYALGTEESIEKRNFVKTTLVSKSLPCYWIMNNPENALFTADDEFEEGEGSEVAFAGYQKVLGENEYFIYSNSALTELEVLGSGTRLTLRCTVPELDRWKIIPANNEELISIATISEKGLAAFESYNWVYRNFNQVDYNLTLEELSILTLTTGDIVKLSLVTGSEVFETPITNTWTDIPTGWKVSYTIPGEATQDLPTYSDSISWKIRSRLDLNAGPDLRQQILTAQKITLTLADGTVRIFDGDLYTDKFIMFNTLIQQAGGEDLDMEVTYLDGSTAYDVSAYTFDYEKPTYEEIGGNIVEVTRGQSGYIQINCKDLAVDGSPDLATIDLPIVSYYDAGDRTSEDGATQLLMIYWDHTTTGSTEIAISTLGAGGIRLYNQGNPFVTLLNINPGINILEINTVTQLTLEITSPSTGTDVLQLGRISVTSGYNTAFGLTPEEVEASPGGLLELIASADSSQLFFYNGTLDSQSLIEFDDLTDARSLFDYNNLANRFTLCQIDFENSKIEIVRTSKV